MCDPPPKEAPPRRQPPSPRNVLKFPLKIDKYLWHGFICCWPLNWRRVCVSNTVTNLSINFPFSKCSKCVVRHLGRPPTSPRNVFFCLVPLKTNTFEMGWVAVDHWRDEEQVCQTSWPVTNQSIKCLFWKCSKCVVRDLGWPPPSPRNVLKRPF